MYIKKINEIFTISTKCMFWFPPCQIEKSLRDIQEFLFGGIFKYSIWYKKDVDDVFS